MPSLIQKEKHNYIAWTTYLCTKIPNEKSYPELGNSIELIYIPKYFFDNDEESYINW